MGRPRRGDWLRIQGISLLTAFVGSEYRARIKQLFPVSRTLHFCAGLRRNFTLADLTGPGRSQVQGRRTLWSWPFGKSARLCSEATSEGLQSLGVALEKTLLC